MPAVVTKVKSIEAGAFAAGALAAGAVVAGSIVAGAAVDGADLTQGAKADAAVTDPTASASLVAVLKGIIKQLQGGGSVYNLVQEQGKSAIYPQNVTVTVAGTPVQFAARACTQIVIIPYKTNTGTILIGSSTVDALSSPQVGLPLEVGGSMTFTITNANLLYVDAEVSGEGCHVIAL